MEISALEQAERDLAFALAQGDGLAEDEAAARVQRLRGDGCSCGGIDAVPHATDHAPGCDALRD